MPTERYDLDLLRSHLLPLAKWRPFPPASERRAWDALWGDPGNREGKAHVIGGGSIQPDPVLLFFGGEPTVRKRSRGGPERRGAALEKMAKPRAEQYTGARFPLPALAWPVG